VGNRSLYHLMTNNIIPTLAHSSQYHSVYSTWVQHLHIDRRFTSNFHCMYKTKNKWFKI